VLSAMDLSNADKALLEQGVTEILKKGASTRDELLQIVHDMVQTAAENRPRHS